MRSSLLMATVLAMAASSSPELITINGPADRTRYPWELDPDAPRPKKEPEPKVERPIEITRLSKKARKLYSKVLRETQSMEEAMMAVRNME